jgi:hypothetical protein
MKSGLCGSKARASCFASVLCTRPAALRVRRRILWYMVELLLTVKVESDVNACRLDILQTLDSSFQSMRRIKPSKLTRIVRFRSGTKSRLRDTHRLNSVHLDCCESHCLAGFRLLQHIARPVTSNPSINYWQAALSGMNT